MESAGRNAGEERRCVIMWEETGELHMVSKEQVTPKIESAILHNEIVPKLFFVGQKLKINNGWFRVKSLKPNEMRLRSIPAPKDEKGGE